MLTIKSLSICGVTALMLLSAPSIAQSIAYIQQVGHHNRAEIEQGGSAESTASVEQRGSFNSHRIEQRNGSGNHAAITVFGEGNGSGQAGKVRQTGSHQTALTLTDGSGNRFSIDQSGGHGANLAALVQMGEGNRASIAQSNTATIVGTGVAGGSAFAAAARGLDITGNGGTLASQIQGLVLGSANASLQIQAGTGNSAEMEQFGRGNFAIQTQLGNDNTMTGTQMGDGNRIVHTQIGNGIVGPQIVQSGHQSITVTQVKP